MTLLEEVLAERWPAVGEVEAECNKAIPERPWTRGGMGMSRFEVLLRIARRAAS